MRLKNLESELQVVARFDKPKIQLEQYCTTPHLAARMLYTAHTVYDDIESKVIADFGCGCGILSIAANLLDSNYNLALDIDNDALQIAKENCSEFEVDVEFILADLISTSTDHLQNKVDTIVMNPPFGTKNNEGIDIIFLKKAIEIATTSVYSLHKSSTREYIREKAKNWGVECEVLAEMKFDIPMMYKIHKKKSVDIEVDFIRFAKKSF
ncbi:S-adenosyl-L-methionine-dependent methyltransferase [Rhizophagus irregularis]|uniref:Methyltransferase-like protein 5 n=1 Tax=Rhizophagus irregularis TaxID=588596 RepID=A0A2I1E074_9GLOM|nr:S-adenosyl-L-methionine-dependent methyltransferase [Rhizophagus irregularis]PKC74280.1 S-adenosyl-L-methionine-dependent methyltransferase [Rhizophagus irregularis]PKY15522.1 S-adenosyl-L-methionine-dependent methyltransferase [Rhizophagus irregularis]